MAVITVTATAIIPVSTSSPQYREGTFGGTVTAGALVYESATNVFSLAECDGVAALAAVVGVAVNGGSAGQFAKIQIAGDVTTDAVWTAGVRYYLSATLGKACLYSDLVSTNRIVELGWATSTTNFRIDITNTGLAVA